MLPAVYKAYTNLNPGYGCALVSIILVIIIGGWVAFTLSRGTPDISDLPLYPHVKSSSKQTQGTCTLSDIYTSDDPQTAFEFYESSLTPPQWEYLGPDYDLSPGQYIEGGRWSSGALRLDVKVKKDILVHTIVTLRLCSLLR